MMEETKDLKSLIEEGFEVSKILLSSNREVFEAYSKMDTIADEVIDIADKIKNLSVNIKIQAAHAGEFGNSFSVIGNEVSKLGEQSINEIKKLMTLIFSMQVSIMKGCSNSNQNYEIMQKIKNISA
jgi:methyl-accepting chemotaxis protein